MKTKIMITIGFLSSLCLVNAFAQSPQPLTLSSSQAAKLKEIFPQSVTEKDLENAQDNLSEHLIWNKIPLKIDLPVNHERMVTFTDSVQFGYDTNKLSADILSVQNVNGTVYLLAKKPFETERVFVQLKTGEMVLLDLSAKENVESTPLSIIVPEVNTKLTESIPLETSEELSSKITDVQLCRFAIQQLYAPKRLLKNPANIDRVAMHTDRTVSLIRGDTVIAMPLISWRSGDEYITAVLLRNRLDRAVILDPRQLRGQWKMAAFFPQTRIASVGNPNDSTTVFLISDQPFVQSMGV